MPPSVALLAWFILVLALLFFDPAKESKPSLALWVPLIWIFIIGSRLPSQWLGNPTGLVAQSLEEGNPLDRAVSFLLILLAIGILASRSFKWDNFFTRNIALIAFVSFALVSVVWSDFPFIAFKRWFRDLGNYLVILVVLTDPHPLEAVRMFLRRLCFLLIPLSILLIKYFPYMGRQYTIWSGSAMYVGAATSKNMLGAACLISGIFFFWDIVTRWSDRKQWRTKKIIVLDLVLIAMTLWLLNLANSATSKVCLVIGCLVILAVHSKWGHRHPTTVKVLVPASFCLYLILAFGFNLSGEFASQVGRDPTLTDRTAIWKLVLSIPINPLLGTGYESFWLGSRLETVWRAYGGINESHNGYLEVYLNLGLVGAFLLCGLVVSSYRHICRQLTTSASLASLNLAFWTIMLFYNMTEAAFKSHLMWETFLLAAMVMPQLATERVRGAALAENVISPKRLSEPRLESMSLQRKPASDRSITEVIRPRTELQSPPAKRNSLAGKIPTRSPKRVSMETKHEISFAAPQGDRQKRGR
jgi:exopolysaccharide production protein ExoQ